MVNEDEEVTKDRIIQHMNNDHSESILLFLQHFSQVTLQDANGARIDDISLSQMRITTPDKKSYLIPIDPPMKSWAEVRQRMKEMDSIARKALGLSNVRLNTYKPPTPPLHLFMFCLCTSIYFSCFLINWGASSVPGTILSYILQKRFPGGLERSRSLVNKATLSLLACHTAETWYMDRSRLGKYGIRRGTTLWWCWVSSCMIEGIGSFRRLDAEVKRIKDRAENIKN